MPGENEGPREEVVEGKGHLFQESANFVKDFKAKVEKSGLTQFEKESFAGIANEFLEKLREEAGFTEAKEE